MTKKELINQIRIEESMTWNQATRIVDRVFDTIATEVAKGNNVYIPKFGKFFLASVADKHCKHPVTKEDMITPKHNVIRLRMAAGMKQKLKDNAE